MLINISIIAMVNNLHCLSGKVTSDFSPTIIEKIEKIDRLVYSENLSSIIYCVICETVNLDYSALLSFYFCTSSHRINLHVQLTV